MKNKILLLFLMSLPLVSIAQHREFYRSAINTTILLYKKTKGQLKAHGTAFVLHNYNDLSEESILITCEHVTHHDTLIAAIPATDSLKNALIKNKQDKFFFQTSSGLQTVGFDGNNLLFSIPLQSGNNYYKHTTLDLATIFCNIPARLINKNNEVVPLTNMKTLPKSLMTDKDDLFAGQEITFVGFPSGIGTQNGFYGTKMYRDVKTNPLFRRGIISWTSENADMFLVDGFSYSGNSGSPIFSIPDATSEGKFIGMVIGHLNSEVEVNSFSSDSATKVSGNHKTYIDVNNGLAECIPAHIIYDFALEALNKRTMLLTFKKENS